MFLSGELLQARIISSSEYDDEMVRKPPAANSVLITFDFPFAMRDFHNLAHSEGRQANVPPEASTSVLCQIGLFGLCAVRYGSYALPKRQCHLA